MKAKYLVVTLLILSHFLACTSISGHVTVEEDVVEPPPVNFKSRFKTLEEWLTYIYRNERPSKTIDTYNFGLFEGQDNYTLYLTGTNTYETSKDHSQIRIEFSPDELYFSLPETDFKGLKREEIYAKITSQLKEFMKTDTYKNSFFIKTTHVKTEWNGETWP
ncbi:MAG: hypothetical protein ACQUHE_17605 [Bacteroidia bacterium]